MASYEKSTSPFLGPHPDEIKKEKDVSVYTSDDICQAVVTPCGQDDGQITAHQHSPADIKSGLASIGSRRHESNTPIETNQEGGMRRPSSPTQTCNLMKEDMSKISHTLVELAVIDQVGAMYCQYRMNEIICAVASKVVLMTPQGTPLLTPAGAPLNVDLTCYWCNLCPFKSESKEMLIQHIVEHRFVCKFCQYQSFSRSDVIQHAFKHHSKFKETAETLKFCIILPDYLRAGNKVKRKLSDSGDETQVCKKEKLDEENEACSFDMEVDEIDDGGKLPAIHGEKILVPSGRKTIDEHATSTSTTQYTFTSTSVSVVPQVEVGSPSPIFVNPTAQTNVVHPSTPQPITIPPIIQPAVTTIQQSIPQPVTITTNQVHETAGKSGELSWKCGHCEYTSMDQAILKIHIQQVHVGQPFSYVALLASMPENLNQVIPARMAYSIHDTTNIAPPATVIPEEDVDAPKVVIENVESDEVKDVLPPSPTVEINITKEMALKEQQGTDPVSFKCAHCNFTNISQFSIKDHLFQKHSGSVTYALDMKAVKLKQPQYVFFCHKKKCYFSTKSTETYSIHAEACTPWLERGADLKNIDEDSKRSLILTLQFARKVEGKSLEISKTFTSVKTAEYACLYCSYISNNNTRLKKHVLSNHVDRDTIMKDIQAAKAEKNNVLVYFCKHCLWETREAKDVKPHLMDRHKEMDAKDIVAPASIISGAEKAAEQKTIGEPATKINKKKPDPVKMKEKAKPIVKNPIVKRGRPPKGKPIQITETSSEDEDEGLAVESEFVEEEDIYPNIEDNVLQKVMTEYIESQDITTSSRTRRKASEKAKITMLMNRYPSLFTCGHCDKFCFGTELMRSHIKNQHESLGMIVTQIGKKNANNAKKYLCPKEKCDFCDTRADQVSAHAKKQHGYQNSDSEIVNIKNTVDSKTASKSEEKVPEEEKLTIIPVNEDVDVEVEVKVKSSPSGKIYSDAASQSNGESSDDVEGNYECLYCYKGSTNTILEMKEHFQTKHPNEDMVFRDRVAWKNRKASRMYMCAFSNCSYLTSDKRECSLHNLAHKKSRVYECIRCQWFTSDHTAVPQHMADEHQGEAITTLAIDLELDAKGSICKKILGTVIKEEGL